MSRLPGQTKAKDLLMGTGITDSKVCLDVCNSFYDYQECQKLCLSVSPSLHRQLFLQGYQEAISDNVPHEIALVFAAGAVWGWEHKRRKQ